MMLTRKDSEQHVRWIEDSGKAGKGGKLSIHLGGDLSNAGL